MELLVVEDDAVIASGLVYALEQEGYGVRQAATVAEARRLLASAASDLAIVDMQLPDGDGFAVGEAALARGAQVIFLTVMDDEERIVRALDEGAADYVTKPFRLRELLARVRRALPEQEAPLMLGAACVDTASGRVTVDGQEVPLTALEYRLCLVFALESVLCTLRAIAIGVPLAVLLTYLVALPVRAAFPIPYYFPLAAILVCCGGVLALTLSITALAARRLRRENIIARIRSGQRLY